MSALQLSEPAEKGRRSRHSQVGKKKAISPKQPSPGKIRNYEKDENVPEKAGIIKKDCRYVNDGEKPSTSGIGTKWNLSVKRMQTLFPKEHEELSESGEERRIIKVDIRKEETHSTEVIKKPSESGVQHRGRMDIEKEEAVSVNIVKKQLSSSTKKRRGKTGIKQEESGFKTDEKPPVSVEKLSTSGMKRSRKKVDIKQERLFETEDKPPISVVRKRKRKAGTEEMAEYKVPTQKKWIKKSVRNKYVGAHMSISGGIWKIFDEAESIGARAIGLFLGSQRKWDNKPLKESAVHKFHEERMKHKFSTDFILPHGSYLMNCGSPNEEIFEKSCTMLVEELRRCEQLGLKMFNFHPGSTLNKISVEECIKRIAFCINCAHQQTEKVVTVLENMSCQGNTVGGKFEELQQIISLVVDKSRVGVCIDTCHAFAAGYDLSRKGGLPGMLDYFNRVVGLKYLKAIHLNDSKGKLGCHLDRHENIGKGYIGLEGFKFIMSDPLLNDIPMILETPSSPYCDYVEEIQTLYSLCD